MSEAKVFKTSVNLPEATVAALKQLSQKQGKSLSQVIRDAIATEALLQKTTDAGGTVLLKGADNKIQQLLVR